MSYKEEFPDFGPMPENAIEEVEADPDIPA